MPIVWFIKNLDDVRSDFSVYHRVDEIEHLPADRFVMYVKRIPFYDGAVAFLLRKESQESEPVEQPHESFRDVRELMRTDPLFIGQGTAVDVPAA